MSNYTKDFPNYTKDFHYGFKWKWYKPERLLVRFQDSYRLNSGPYDRYRKDYIGIKICSPTSNRVKCFDLFGGGPWGKLGDKEYYLLFRNEELDLDAMLIFGKEKEKCRTILSKIKKETNSLLK